MRTQLGDDWIGCRNPDAPAGSGHLSICGWRGCWPSRRVLQDDRRRAPRPAPPGSSPPRATNSRRAALLRAGSLGGGWRRVGTAARGDRRSLALRTAATVAQAPSKCSECCGPGRTGASDTSMKTTLPQDISDFADVATKRFARLGGVPAALRAETDTEPAMPFGTRRAPRATNSAPSISMSARHPTTRCRRGPLPGRRRGGAALPARRGAAGESTARDWPW